MKTKIANALLVVIIAAASASLLAAQNTTIQARPSPEHGVTITRTRVRTGNEGWLGVELADVTQAKAQQMKLPGVYGAIVAHVEENSPAAKAGIQPNDVILKFAGTRVWSVAQLAQWVRQTPPGRTVPLRVSRAGKLLDLSVDIGPLREHGIFARMNAPDLHLPEVFNFSFSPMRARLGIRGENLTPQLASYFGVKQGKGVLVAEVEKGSPAEKAGLKAGDCIVRVNSIEVNGVFDLMHALNSAKKQPVTLAIIRGGHEESLSVTLAPPWNPFPPQESQELQRRLQEGVNGLRGEFPRIAEEERQLDSPEFQRRLQYELDSVQKQLPRIEQQEKQLQSCLDALESHLFELRSRPIQQTAMVRGPHGSWAVTGPGCPATPAGSGGK